MALVHKRIGIVVGEASGDQLGAPVIQALKQRYPEVELVGIAGPKMIEAGCRTLYDMERLSLMGFDLQVVSRLWELYTLRRFLIKHFIEKGLDLFIGIDAPAFNIGLEEKLKRSGIKTLHYVSPSVWAWRSKRIFKIKRAVDLMLVMLPFETDIYLQHRIPVRYIGHPLADKFPLQPDVQAARANLGLEEKKNYIALMPGSRRGEINLMCRDILSAAKELSSKIDDCVFIVPMINRERETLFNEILADPIYKGLAVKVVVGDSHSVMAAADMIILSSGTATLEALLLKKPMIVVYRFSKLSYWIAQRLVKLPYISLPNLLAGKKLVAELVQDELEPRRLAALAYELWCDKSRQEALQEAFSDIHRQLKHGATEKFVESVLNMVEGVD